MEHVGTNDMGKCSCKILKDKFSPQGKRLKAKTTTIAFSEMLLLDVKDQINRHSWGISMHRLNDCVKKCSLDLLGTGPHLGTKKREDNLHLNQNAIQQR